jgi:hypothetical protein
LVRDTAGEARTAPPAGGEIQRRKAQPVGLRFVPVRARESAVHIGEDADPGRAGTILVGGEEALEDRRGDSRLVGVQH